MAPDQPFTSSPRVALVALVGFFGAGCVGPTVSQIEANNPANESAVADRTTVEKDPFIGALAVVAPPFSFRAGGEPGVYALLESRGEIWMRCTFIRREWAFFETAWAIGGRRLESRIHDRKVESGYTVTETIDVRLDRADVIEAPGDLWLRFDGKRGSAEVVIPQFYLLGFASKLGATK